MLAVFVLVSTLAPVATQPLNGACDLQNLRFVSAQGELQRLSVGQPLALGESGWIEADLRFDSAAPVLTPGAAVDGSIGTWRLSTRDGAPVLSGLVGDGATSVTPFADFTNGRGHEAVLSIRWQGAKVPESPFGQGLLRLDLDLRAGDWRASAAEEFAYQASPGAEMTVLGVSRTSTPAGSPGSLGATASSSAQSALWLKECIPGYVVIGAGPQREICGPCKREPTPIGDCVGESGGTYVIVREGACVFAFDSCTYRASTALGDVYAYASKREKPCGSITIGGSVSGSTIGAPSPGGSGSAGGTVQVGGVDLLTATCCTYQKLNQPPVQHSFLDCN